MHERETLRGSSRERQQAASRRLEEDHTHTQGQATLLSQVQTPRRIWPPTPRALADHDVIARPYSPEITHKIILSSAFSRRQPPHPDRSAPIWLHRSPLPRPRPDGLPHKELSRGISPDRPPLQPHPATRSPSLPSSPPSASKLPPAPAHHSSAHRTYFLVAVPSHRPRQAGSSPGVTEVFGHQAGIPGISHHPAPARLPSSQVRRRAIKLMMAAARVSQHGLVFMCANGVRKFPSTTVHTRCRRTPSFSPGPPHTLRGNTGPRYARPTARAPHRAQPCLQRCSCHLSQTSSSRTVSLPVAINHLLDRCARNLIPCSLRCWHITPLSYSAPRKCTTLCSLGLGRFPARSPSASLLPPHRRRGVCPGHMTPSSSSHRQTMFARVGPSGPSCTTRRPR